MSGEASREFVEIALHKQLDVSFWDAMVIHAAAELGCDVLWTEDLHDGQVIAAFESAIRSLP